MSDHRTTYRYKLSPEIIDEITRFSKIHMFSSREVFREKWNEWLISNNELIDIEKARLTEIGYTKSVTAKMFISARYYFKNKEFKPEQDTSKEKETSKTRAYIKISKELLKEIDIYIGENSNRDVKPSTSYELFTELNRDLIDRETNRLTLEVVKNEEEKDKDEKAVRDNCRAKIKKTFKNRCFVLENNKTIKQ
tara:strand:+ start:894 stop:1475 length:582 start_codon:yes stop_codon:yes gene_type:complete